MVYEFNLHWLQNSGFDERLNRIIENSFEGVKRTSDIITSLKFFANSGLEDLVDLDLEKLLYEV